jgi:hypothetical protein
MRTMTDYIKVTKLRAGCEQEQIGGPMDTTAWLLLAVFVVGLVALIGFFVTKTQGFGRFATSTFLLVVVVIVSALLYAAGRLDCQVLANIFFAVIGFSGGLFTGKETDAPNKALNPGAQKPPAG